jgi:hypothetical protein
MTRASEVAGHAPERFGIVARLLVSPVARRESSVASARCRHCGWARAGHVTMRFGDGAALDEFVYLAPHDLA